MSGLSGRVWGWFTGKGPGDARRRWYHEGEAAHLQEHHRRTRDAHAGSLAEARTYLAMYYNRPMLALDAQSGSKIIGFDGVADLGFNVLGEALRGGKAQVVQQLQARVTPVGGDWDRKLACEKLGQVIDGTMDLCNFTDLAGQMMVDGCLTGEGFGLVEVDPIKKDFTDVRLDPLETFYNFDRTEVMTLRAFTRRKAMAWWPEHKDAIWNAPQYKPEHVTEVDHSGEWDCEDLVGVYQAWCQGVGDTPGRFVYVLHGTKLVLDEGEWDMPLPVFSFRWDYGHRENGNKPMARAVAPMHYWLNEIVRNTYETIAGNVPYIESSRDPDWSDVPYKWIPLGENARVHMPNLTGVQLNLQMKEELRKQVMREVGMSEEAVHGAAPPQFKSGVALSNWREIVNKGLSGQHRQYEGTWSLSARIKVAWMPKVYSSRKAVAKAMGTGVIEQIDLTQVNLPEDAYIVAWDVVSALPKTLPQKIELLAYLEEKGKIDADDVVINLTNPDMHAVIKRITGPRALMDTQISRALNDEELIPPSEVQDNAKLAELAGQAYQAAQVSFPKPKRGGLQKLLHLYLMAKQLAGTTTPAATAAGLPTTGAADQLGQALAGAPAGAPGGVPGAPAMTDPGAPAMAEVPGPDLTQQLPTG